MNFIAIKAYIRQDFGEIVAEVFKQKVADLFKLLKNFPEIGSIEIASKQIEGFQLTKQTTIFYRVKDQKIIILTFFDVRQHPEKKPQ